MISVLVDERISDSAERALLLKGFYPIRLPRHPSLPDAISSHPDSLIFYHGKELFAPAEYCDLAPYVFTDIRERHPNIKIRFTSDTLGNSYPEDCKMNALCINNKLFANPASLSESVSDYARESGIKLVGTRQGYPACTTLAFGSFAITSDKGLAKTLSANGVSVTIIQNGGISLPPYEYGFIGGASGVFCDKVYFLGDYKSHPSGEAIEQALTSKGFTPISLSNEPLADLGGLIFLE